MFDTINLKLWGHQTPNTDLLSETPNYLENVVEHCNGNGLLFLTGRLGNLKVFISPYQVQIKDGSLCKWYLGTNLKTLTRKDTQLAIEKLNDTLHLPINKAEVTRCDIAQNILLNHPVDVYTSHLGELNGFNRLVQPHSLYYSRAETSLIFYDKIRELKSKGDEIPTLYKGRNILRFEKRLLKKIPHQLNIGELNAEMLYDEAVYIRLIDLWLNSYKSISTINDIQTNFEAMKSKKELYRMALCHFINARGGQLTLLNEIKEQQKKGILTNKQALDLRCAIKEAVELKEGVTIQNEQIIELNNKIEQSIKFYR